MIFLRVGNGTNFADNASINRIRFALTAAQVGSGVAISQTAPVAGVSARVLGTGGNVSFTARGPAGGLANGVQRIAWSQILPTASAGSLPHPAIGNGVAGAPATLLAVNGVVDQSATYNFIYANTGPVASGTYNGQVTYTAALP